MGSQYQKRFDKLTREKSEALEENKALREECHELESLLLRYERLISKYKLALRQAKKENNVGR